MYSDQDYIDAIKFALNYPPDVKMYKYDIYKDIYKVNVFDYGWYDLNLTGSFVRSCLKWKGNKIWTQ
jgi:hypothetical protein